MFVPRGCRLRIAMATVPRASAKARAQSTGGGPCLCAGADFRRGPALLRDETMTGRAAGVRGRLRLLEELTGERWSASNRVPTRHLVADAVWQGDPEAVHPDP
jgi:hypothetical protein